MNTVIPDVALIDNSDERAPLALVLDCSGSMQEENKVQLLNEGLKALAADLKAIGARNATIGRPAAAGYWSYPSAATATWRSWGTGPTPWTSRLRSCWPAD